MKTTLQNRMVDGRELANRAAAGLARIRAWRGLTQDELRTRLEKVGPWVPSRNTISVHERGGSMTIQQLGAYAQALECSHDDLLGAGGD